MCEKFCACQCHQPACGCHIKNRPFIPNRPITINDRTRIVNS